MRKLVWAVGGSLGAILLLIVAMLGIGALIPIDHTASLTARYQRPPDEVWRAITDYTAFPDWRSGVDEVAPFETAGGRGGWIERGSTGALPLAVVESVPPTRLVLRIAADNLGFGGTWTYELAPDQGGTRLTITEDGTIPNLFFRFMSRFVFGYSATIETYLVDLGAKFGAPVTPTPTGG